MTKNIRAQSEIYLFNPFSGRVEILKLGVSVSSLSGARYNIYFYNEIEVLTIITITINCFSKSQNAQ